MDTTHVFRLRFLCLVVTFTAALCSVVAQEAVLRVDSERRFSTEPSWFRFLDRRTSYQLLSLRDPGPLLGYVLENLRKSVVF